MKKLIIICAALLLASPALGANYTDYTQPYDVNAGTLGLWHFDEVTGSDTVYDATANNNDGVIDPGANMYGYGPLDPNVSYTSSMAGFNTATNTWLVSTANNNIGTWVVEQDLPSDTQGNSTLFLDGDFSIEFWMNANYTSGASWQDYILAKGTGSVYNLRYVNNSIELGWYGIGVGWTGVADTTSIALSEWHHVSLRVDNLIGAMNDESHIEFWIDGVLSTAFDAAGFQDDANQGYDLTISGAPGGHPYNGYSGHLDELRISNYVVPEPTMISLLAMAALAFLRRKK